MKLIQHTGRQFLLYSIAVLLAGSLGLYFTMKHLIREELDDSLHYVRTSIEKNPEIFHEEPFGQELLGDLIFLRPISHSSTKETFTDTSFYSTIEGEIEPFRKYTFHTTLGKKVYEVAICRKRIENKDILINIGGWTFGILFVLILILNMVNRRVAKYTWSPFYRALQSIKTFSLGTHKAHSQPLSGIDEFDDLNRELHQMTGKMLQDYVALKQFTENASHEIQTPLAVMQTKTELLYQSIDDQQQLQHVDDIRAAASKLAGINHSLLLLARIENRQFAEIKSVQVDVILKSKVDTLKPLTEGIQIEILHELHHTEVLANPYLLESLLSNLLMNAIRHNLSNGIVEIVLADRVLLIRNTGRPLTKTPELLFKRFSKDDESGTSTGLGLAIVQEICVQHGWRISYRNEGKWHEVRVAFGPFAI